MQDRKFGVGGWGLGVGGWGLGVGGWGSMCRKHFARETPELHQTTRRREAAIYNLLAGAFTPSGSAAAAALLTHGRDGEALVCVRLGLLCLRARSWGWGLQM